MKWHNVRNVIITDESGYSYTFSSGAGGWAIELNILSRNSGYAKIPVKQ